MDALLPNGRKNPEAGITLALLAEIVRNEIEPMSRIVFDPPRGRQSVKDKG
jgi:hypothetical protein